MRLHVLSDLHLDYLENRQRLAQLRNELASNPVDAFVLPGDVSHKPDQVDDALRTLADLAPTRLFVAGNHDVWVVRPKPGEETDSWRKLDLLRDLATKHGYHDLGHGNVRLDGFTFVGSIGWYDYTFANPALGLPARDYEQKRWNELTYMDREYARWGTTDAAVVDRLLAELRPRLSKAEGKVVFVSHHVPLEELVLRRGAPSWDFFNAYMGSRRIEDAVRQRGVTRFIFGHTHRPVTLLEPGRFVINNPLGYPRQALNPVRRGFDVS